MREHGGAGGLTGHGGEEGARSHGGAAGLMGRGRVRDKGSSSHDADGDRTDR